MNNTIHFLWIDCEMTGLNPDVDHILEIAIIITDKNLTSIYEKEWVISCDHNILDTMNDWCKNYHGNSGLTEKSKNSLLSYALVEAEIKDALKHYTQEKKVYIAGNSVYNDVMFLRKHMPHIITWCHYRLLDISTLKIIKEIWNENIIPFEKQKKHTALSDIKESLAEFEYYKNKLFINF